MMFKTSAIFLTLTAALKLVLASSVTITSPEANAVWEAGSTVEIKWKVNDAASAPIRLQYASGPSKSLTINGLIADNVTASLGSYTWKIPADIKERKYVIEAGPSAKDLSFLGYINIKNKKHSTTKKGGKKTTTKKTGTKKTIKKGGKKTTTASKKKPTAVCVGYPNHGQGTTTADSVRCHSLPKAESQHKKKKTTTTKKHKKTTKKTTKKKSTTPKPVLA